MSVIFQSVSAVQSEEIVHGCNYSACSSVLLIRIQDLQWPRVQERVVL